ncbi:MAG: DUF4258 domain-containing protein [Candidatus Thermoplasmatota archaeon]
MQCLFRPTLHAKVQMIERGISKFELIDVISRGAKRRQGQKVISHLRKIEVVFIPKKCNLIILTTYRRGG